MFGETGGGPDGALSCTHDANAWPADRYAGLPAPAPGERVVLWVQNSHPTPIPAGRDRPQPDGRGRGRRRWPSRSGRSPAARSMSPNCCPILPGRGRSSCGPASMSSGRATRSSPASGRRIAHVNVERADLRPDPKLPDLAALLGKGYLLPAPVLPREPSGKACCCRRRWRCRRPSCRWPRSSTTPTAARWRDSGSAGCRATTRPRCDLDESSVLARRSAAVTAMSSWSTISRGGGERRRLAARAVPLSPPRQRPRRRDQLRRACVQHDPDLSRRAAILCRPAARACRPGCSCGSATAATTRCAT